MAKAKPKKKAAKAAVPVESPVEKVTEESKVTLSSKGEVRVDPVFPDKPAANDQSNAGTVQ